MSLPEDPTERKKWLAERFLAYGERYSVFSPRDQPIPDEWEPEIPEPDEKGRLHPETLKAWYYLPQTIDFLAARYDIPIPHISEPFDCPVRRIQGKAVLHEKATADYVLKVADLEALFHLKDDDDPSWYASALRVYLVAGGKIGFSCESATCFRLWCDLHMMNPKQINPADIYNLVQVFEGLPSAEVATKIVAEWFGLMIGKFESTGARKKKEFRYRVPKGAIYDLIRRHRNLHRKEIPKLVNEAIEMIASSPEVEYHRRLFSPDHVHLSRSLVHQDTLSEMGPALQLYLFVLLRQEEEASQNRFKLTLTDEEISEATGIPRPTVTRYRKQLLALGFLTIEDGIWKAHYRAQKW